MSASSVKWVQLGEYIESCDERNSEGKYTLDDVRGISTDKKFISTKANMDGVSLTSYKVVNRNEFAYVADTSRRGDKIALALNSTSSAVLISSIYTAFRSKDIDKLLPDYLYLILSRSEFDRYSRFNSWGSARETFDWSEFCRTKIPLPSIDVQQELVDTYNGLKALAEQNEALIEPLSKACEAFIVDCKTKYPEVELGKFMIKGEKNSTKTISKVLGVAQSGFITPQKDPNESLANYKIMRYKAICYAPPLYNIKSDAIQIYEYEEPAVCSPIYEVFYVDEKYILPHYLFIKLKRQEFKRYAEYYALGVRQTFNYELMEQVKIPLPPIEIQQSIVNLYNCLEEAKKIASEAREKLKTLCPALVQRAANS